MKNFHLVKFRFPVSILWTIPILQILTGCAGNSDTLIISVGNKYSNEDNSYKTIKEALLFAENQKSNNKNLGIELKLTEGTFYLDEPIKLSHELAGFKLLGKGRGKTVIKGSKILEGVVWEKYSDSIFVTNLPVNKNFTRLYVNEKQMIRARYPNYNENGGHWQGHSQDAIDPERIKKWKNPETGIFHVMHGYEWGDFHYKVIGLDENGEAELVGGTQNNRPAPMHKKYRMVENVFEELDAPGEWFFDTKTSQLFLWPTKPSELKGSKLEVVFLKNLLTLKGKDSQKIKDIEISGISFRHTSETLFEEYEPLLRSDWTIYRGGAVFIENAEDVSITDCGFRDLGGNAIMVSGYARDILINRNLITETGASGVSFVGNPKAVRSPSFQYSEYVPFNEMDTVRGPKTEDYPMNCTVDNNLIFRTGRIEKQTAGVQIAMSAKIKVSRNSIYDVPRAGINIGDGTWGGHIIEYNDVFNTVLESGDHGSFNSWGRDRFWHPNRKKMDSLNFHNPSMFKWDAIYTTEIRNNRFRCDHGWDIDLDDGSSNYKVYNNLCLNGGIKFREGFNRSAVNNIMVNNGFHPHVWFKNSQDVFKHNIVATGHRDIRLQGWGKEVDYNFFPDEESLMRAINNNTDLNSKYGDPKFLDPKNGNFNVEPNSETLSIGFKNFPMDSFGVQNDKLVSMAKTPNIPQILLNTSTDVDEENIEWLGLILNAVTTLGERSAAGLKENSGLVVLNIIKGTLAEKSSIQTGDVILEAENITLKSGKDLISVYQSHNWKGKINFVVMRNQKEIQIVFQTK